VQGNPCIWCDGARPGSVKTVVPHGVTREGYAVP
jgi:hypothetical protein